jgi:hypothetical protein
MKRLITFLTVVLSGWATFTGLGFAEEKATPQEVYQMVSPVGGRDCPVGDRVASGSTRAGYAGRNIQRSCGCGDGWNERGSVWWIPKTSRKFSDSGLLPGGTPSTRSGDGTSPRKAIYIGGTWREGLRPTEAEMPTCATIKSPAGTSRWFKADTWKDRQLIVWLDDELNDATRPSGSAVFGAADDYMKGTASGGFWQKNAYFDGANSVGWKGANPSAEGCYGDLRP